jgi:hypothetical protein
MRPCHGIAVLATGLLVWARTALAQDVTDKLETVGAPPASEESARDIWDLQSFEGRLFVASAGTRDLFSLDPKGAELTKEISADGEWIDFLRVVGAALFTAGRSSKPSPDAESTFHRLEGKTWTVLRGLPKGSQVRDVAVFGGKVFAALQTPAGAAVARASEKGTWEPLWSVKGERARSFLAISRGLYLSTDKGRVYQFTGRGFELAEEDFFPGIRTDRGALFAARVVSFHGQTAYIGARATHPGWSPVALFVGRTADSIGNLSVRPDLVLRDLLPRRDTLYVLASSAKGPIAEEQPYKNPQARTGPQAAVAEELARAAGKPAPADGGATPDGGADGGTAEKAAPHAPGVWVWVVATKNFLVWEEILAFRAETFARSFERIQGDFYFGLGSDSERPSAAAGKILRVKAAHWRTAPDAWLY